MPHFTCITLIRDSFHLTQHPADRPEDALREHIGKLPYDDGEGPFDDGLDWLLGVAEGRQSIELLPLTDCPGTWMWLDGARYKPPYSTYIVRTAVA